MSYQDRVYTRFGEQQPLWVLAGPDATLLCARHASAGMVILAWTTREELEMGVSELFGHAPMLFERHTAEQRPFVSLLQTANRLCMRLRVDDFVVEHVETASQGAAGS